MGMAAIGMAILGAASFAASFFLRPKIKLPDTSSDGPRLGDLTATTSQYGIGIPRVWGTYLVTGNVIWTGRVTEHANVTTTTVRTGGGKGGGGGGSQTHTQTSYTYTTSLAVGLTTGKIDRVLKILMDGELVYDATCATLDTTVPGLVFRLYHGTEDQDRDPTMVAQLGAENTPAHRGLAYIVFDELNITTFGNRMPQMQFLVQREGTTQTLTQALGTTSPFAVSWGLSRYYEVAGGQLVARAVATDAVMRSVSAPSAARVVYADRSYVAVFYSAGRNHRRMAVYDAHALSLMHDERVEFRGAGSGLDAPHVSGQRSLVARYTSELTGDQRVMAFVAMSDYYFIGAASSWAGTTIFDMVSGEVITSDPNAEGLRGWHSWFDVMRSDVTSVTVAWLHDADVSGQLVLDVVVLHDDLEISYGLTGADWRAKPVLEKLRSIPITTTLIDPQGRIAGFFDSVYSGPNYSPVDWVLHDSADGGFIISACDGIFTVKLSSTGSVLWRFCSDESFVWNSIYLHSSGANYGSRLDGRRMQVRGKKDGVSGRYTLDTSTGEVVDFYPVAGGIGATAWDSNADALVLGSQLYLFGRGAIQGTPVTQIISDLSEDVGVAPGDMTDIEGLAVTGYLQAKPSEARGVIEPLGQLFNFDALDGGDHLKWVRRGKPSVIDISPDELLAGSNNITTNRADDVSLPQAIAVSYSDPAIDYESSTVYRQRYAGNEGYETNRSRNQKTVEVPAAIPADVAKQAADTILMQAWYGRTTYKIKLPRDKILVDAGDVVTISEPGQLPVDVLIDKATLGAGLQIELSGSAQDSSQYTSTISADVPSSGVVVQKIQAEMFTRLYMLPVPYLDDLNNQNWQSVINYYALGAYDDDWAGGLVDRLDADQLWRDAGQMPFDSAHGTLSADLPAPSKWDVFCTNEQLEIHVALMHGDLETVSQAEMLEGANAAALVHSTRSAEVIQFREAHLQEDGSYILRGILRGRRGTDSAAFNRTVQAGTDFVLLGSRITGASVRPMSAIGTIEKYRGRGANQLPENGDVRAISVEGYEYKPYAPWHVKVELQPNGDWLLTWERRTRLHGGLQGGTGEVALNEWLEQYEIDVYDGGEIVRTVTVDSDAEFLYTEAMQIEDGVVGAGFVVYQMSEQVGRGFPSLRVDSAPNALVAQYSIFAITDIPPPDIFAAQQSVFIVTGTPAPNVLAAQHGVFAITGTPAPSALIAQHSVFSASGIPTPTALIAQHIVFVILEN